VAKEPADVDVRGNKIKKITGCIVFKGIRVSLSGNRSLRRAVQAHLLQAR
jgi:hypothetical protein